MSAITAGACRSCGSPVLWLDHENPPADGKSHRAPIEVATDDGAGFLLPNGKRTGGNVAVDLEAGTYRVLSKSRLAVVGHVGLHINHFLTCPERDQWRRDGGTR